MNTQKIIATRAYTLNDGGQCGCGADRNLFIVDYWSEMGDLTGDYPNLLECQRCLSNARAEAEWFN